MFVKKLFWVAVGAVGALEADKFLERQRERFRPSALTGSLLDRTNRALEKRRDRQSGV
ncbi:MAG: hypothetical protein M3277_06075 [Actinomycetota bacterium]|nr:hypothetical protein [Actinomycetota bacterium]